MLACTQKMSGEDLYFKLKEKAILVRHFSDERIKNFIRITVGTDQETAALLAALKEILEG